MLLLGVLDLWSWLLKERKLIARKIFKFDFTTRIHKINKMKLPISHAEEFL